MNYEVYTDIKISENCRVYEFLSIGKRGSVLKRVAFESTELPNVYNLALGDVSESDELDDSSISDNGDRNKILATIADMAVNNSELLVPFQKDIAARLFIIKRKMS